MSSTSSRPPEAGAGVPGAAPGSAKRHTGRTQAPYPAEFNAEAVRLARAGSVPLARLARELGISQDTLRAWVQRADSDTGERVGVTTDERAELLVLRRRVRVLEEEREILKKATAFFVKEGVTR